MPNAERIAELQRLAYGAGTTDTERGAALDRLEAIRGGRVAESAAVEAADLPAAPIPPADPVASEPSPATAIPALRTPLRSAVVIGALGLVIGYGAGWIGGGSSDVPRAAADAPSATAVPTTPPVAFVPVSETRAIELFDRDPRAAELEFDPILFSGFDVDDAGPRLLATRSDGVTVWAARTVQGDLCVVMRMDEYSSGGGCTSDGLFPVAQGIGIETYHQSLGNYSAFLDEWGELRIRVEGVAGAPQS